MRRSAATALAGLTLTLFGLAFDAAPLFVPAVAFTLLGVLTPAWVLLAARSAGIERRMDARRVLEDEPVPVTIHVGAGLVRPPRAMVLDPLATEPIRLQPIAGASEVRIVVRFPRRGRICIEAPTLIVSDPLEIAHCRRVGAGPAQPVLVLPRTMPVQWGGRMAGDRPGSQGARVRGEALGAVDVEGLAPYRAGTPASRIHWPAMARGAGLLERRLSSETDTRPLVALDARGPLSSDLLDAAVRAAASLVLELARAGGCALLLPGERRATTIGPDLLTWPAAHARLAVVQGGPDSPAPLLRAAGRRGALFYVAARPLGRLPQAVRASARGTRVLVTPAVPPAPDRPRLERRRAGPAHASFHVAGCDGYVVAGRPGATAAAG